MLGGAAGAALLLLTPPDASERIVPWLIAGAAVTILIQRPPAELAAEGMRHHAGRRRDPLWLHLGTFAVGIYGGYFGAAAGVMMLTMFLLGTGEGLPRSNAMRNAVIGVANGIAAVGFVAFTSVAWSAALPLAVGCFAGSRLGPRVVRRAPQSRMRRAIAVAGLLLAVHLGIQAY